MQGKGAERKRKKTREDRERELRDHQMEWLVRATPTLLFGPPPKQRDDALYLTLCCGVTDILNLCPESDKYARAYERHYEDLDDARPAFRYDPLPADKSEKTLLDTVKRLANLLTAEKGRVWYVHATTGFDEEAYVALLAWLKSDPKTFPPDISVWLEENRYRRVLHQQEQRDLLNSMIEKVRSTQNALMSSWVIKKPRLAVPELNK